MDGTGLYVFIISCVILIPTQVLIRAQSLSHNCTEFVEEEETILCACTQDVSPPTNMYTTSELSWVHNDTDTIVSMGGADAYLQVDFNQSFGCAFGWTYHEGSNSCLWFVTAPNDWLAARFSCQEDGADLVRIQNQEMQDFIQDLLTSQGIRDHIYIGLQDRTEFSWTGDTSVIYSSLWASGEPNNFGGDKDCVVMNRTGSSSASLVSSKCSEVNGFVCERQYVGGTCDPLFSGLMWYYNNGWCYCVMTSTKKNWQNAQQFCATAGSNLAKIDSAETHTFLFNFLNTGAYLQGFPYYIGLNNPREFYWLDDDPSITVPYTNWKLGSPSLTETVDDCVFLDNTLFAEGKWQEVHCDTPLLYMCQKEAVYFGSLPRTYSCESEAGSTERLYHTFYPARNDTTNTPTTQSTTTIGTTFETTIATTDTPTTIIASTDPTTTTTTTHPQTIITSQSTVTEMSSSTSDVDCLCSSRPVNATSLTEEQVEYLTAGLQRDLAVDVDSLSATIRKKNCAEDDRVLPRIAALVAISFLLTSFVFIIASDCLHLTKHIFNQKDGTVQKKMIAHTK